MMVDAFVGFTSSASHLFGKRFCYYANEGHKASFVGKGERSWGPSTCERSWIQNKFYQSLLIFASSTISHSRWCSLLHFFLIQQQISFLLSNSTKLVSILQLVIVEDEWFYLRKQMGKI
ncbi:hypothetical protein MKX01_036084 [Papaver californicum]|nr:hypothetical protein MKX01_036084 [Papaver californicum]